MSQRMTPLRQQILELLSHEHMLSAMQLLDKLQREGQEVNKTSVYRSLEFLQNEGLICQHQFDLKEAVYERRDHHHDHLVCSFCGKIQESECSVHPPKEIDGFTIDHHHLTLFGTCAECREKGIRL